MSEKIGVMTRLKFLLAEKLFHSSMLRRSKLRHQWVMRLFRESADAGHLKALTIYGHLLYFRGISPLDKGQGAKYLLDAAKQGDVKAQYQMGCIYEDGYGHLLKSNEHAVRWFVRSAEQGHPLACRRMVKACSNGELGLAVNPDQCHYWEQKARRSLEHVNGLNLSLNH
ncbi:tetratricopeptide repeat protein [Oceanospirillum maris]|jgi:TPR repeat protein|uniref:tetratricopeptide repeat protein n=1 Tax=Oceanospirillum maris TaxID=64977 RepID=UPI000405CEC8|nr:tetratricopeptide repeat protein [Oceanospirillum maris]